MGSREVYGQVLECLGAVEGREVACDVAMLQAPVGVEPPRCSVLLRREDLRQFFREKLNFLIVACARCAMDTGKCGCNSSSTAVAAAVAVVAAEELLCC